jgi:RimJ/RimL family protein N-acetyltransferase
MLNDRNYLPTDAAGFINWAAKGWSEQTHYVFVALDSDGLPVASCDLKTATRGDDEIGYWRSTQVPGSMTAIVAQMLSLAIADGFTRFHAYVEPINFGSVAVLERLGFRLETRDDATGRHLYRRCSAEQIG